jgi:hypothetical protein
MSQFDFKAGTNGAAFCIPSGRERVANPMINIDNGVTIAPTKFKEVNVSNSKVINVVPQVKNNNDSYRLLNGKYPFSTHLQLSITVINKFEIRTL